LLSFLFLELVAFFFCFFPGAINRIESTKNKFFVFCRFIGANCVTPRPLREDKGTKEEKTEERLLNST
jgi:hypothetical protein